MDFEGEYVLGRGNSKGRDPEVRSSLVHFRNSKETLGAGVQNKRRAEGNEGKATTWG